MPTGQGPIDDEKEPHFIEGKRAINTMDYAGAIDEFEKAVEANPRNASAHFELGWLYEKPEPEPDPAAAIYHYQQFLKLRPTADTAEAVRLRIMNCKQDLAKAVLPMPSSPGAQHDMEVLIQENKQLKAEVEQWHAYAKAQATNRAPQQILTPIPPAQTLQTTQYDYSNHSAPPPPVPHTNSTVQYFGGVAHISPHATSGHTYVVQSRDTMASISRKFNVKLESLVVANPGVDAKKIKVGQIVNIP